MSDERNDYKKREELLRKMIESVVVPNYPQIEDIIITSFFFRAMRCYEVLVVINTTDFTLEKKISEEINTLFKTFFLSHTVSKNKLKCSALSSHFNLVDYVQVRLRIRHCNVLHLERPQPYSQY